MKTLDQMHTDLLQKSVDDADFRDRLVGDPKGTISHEYGVDFPEGVSVDVHQSTASQLHIALPPAAVMSEEELNATAAGFFCCT